MNIQLNETEIAARTMIEAYRSEHKDLPMLDIALLSMWEAMYCSALTTSRVNRVASAISGFEGTVDFQKVLTKMVRRKLLRTRMGQEGTLYELNF